MNIIKEYIKNGKEIQRIKTETEQTEKGIREELNKALEIIDNKKEALKVEERNMRHIAEIQTETAEAEERLKMTPYKDQREAVKRIVEFLEVQERNEQISLEGAFEIILHDDDYFKLGIKILRNDKPVNCFDAVVLGSCVFYEPLIKQPYHGHYGVTLGSFKSEGDAKRLIEKKKSTIGQDVIKQVEELKKEYLEVIKTWKLSDFEELFEYNCYDCRGRFDKNVSVHTRDAWNVKPGESKQEPCNGKLHRGIKGAV